EDFINSPKAFLGRGWSFPPNFVKGGNAVDMLEAELDIQSSLGIILSTTVGERIMQPDFGCNLEKLIFEPLDTTFSTYITQLIRNAILYFEPRVTLDDVAYNADDLNGKVDITISFTINGTNTRSNIVFPFYLNEGTDVTQ
ncbi:MAG: GPW/gp25 family protein, partial [Bacteroidia bacterium]